MNNNSYIYLKQELSECRLTDLKIANIHNEEDYSNWIAKIEPFIKQFCQGDDVIFDPFAQFGTTLIASGILGYRAIGIESNTTYLNTLKERIKAYDELLRYKPEVIVGDLFSVPFPEKVDVVITTPPSFDLSIARDEINIHNSSEYTIYLNQIEQVIKRCEKILSKHGYFILFVKNITDLNGNIIPQAFDIGRLIQKYFNLKEERILLSSIESREVLDPTATNSAHTYVFIGTKRVKKLLLQPYYDFIHAIKSIDYALVGALAISMLSEKVVLDNPPTTLDIVVTNQKNSIETVVKALVKMGFDITTKDKKIISHTDFESLDRVSTLYAFKRINGTEYRIKIILHSNSCDLANLLTNRQTVKDYSIATLDDIKKLLLYDDAKVSKALYHRLTQL